MLVGRARELAETAAAFDGVAAGRGRLFVLVGEPGIGKTSLADAIAAEAERRGFAVAWGRCWEGGGAPALFPWRQVFDALGLSLPDASASPATDAGAARMQLFQAAAEALAAAGRDRPLLIVFDDLHVSDVTSLLLLQFVTRELRRVRALIVATRRDVDAALGSEAAALLARLAREGTTLPLRRLDGDEVAAVIAGFAGAGPADAEMIRAICQATQGNPFFLDELLRLLVARGGVAGAARDGLPIPYGVREAIRQRLTGLDPEVRAVLEVAAVLGEEADLAALALAGGFSREDVAARIASAVQAGAVDEPAGGRVVFAHALIREVLDRDLPASRRGDLHLAAADALERLHPDDPPLPEIAHHAIAAAPREPARLIRRVGRAAARLLDGYAHEDAVLLVERARAALEPTLDDARLRAELLLGVGEARSRAGDLAGGREAFRRAADAARGVDTALLARAAIGYGTEFVVGVTDPALLALLREALAALPAEARGWRARVQARLAATLQPAIDPDVPIHMAGEAIAEARALGDDATLLDVIHAGMAAMMTYADPGLRRPLNELAATLAERLGQRDKLLRARLRLVFDLVALGELAAADTGIDEYERLARGTRQPRHLWLVPLLRGMRALMEGSFGEADTLADEAREIAAQVGGHFTSFCLGLHRYGRLRHQGRFAESAAARPLLTGFAAHQSSLLLANLAASQGDRDEARRLLQDVVPWPEFVKDPTVAVMLAEIAVWLDDRDLAAHCLPILRGRCGQWLCWELTGVFVDGTYDRFAGTCAALVEAYDEAESHFRAALELAIAARARPEQARILAGHAAMLARRGDASRAAELAARARALADELDLRDLRSDDVAAAPPGPAATGPRVGLSRDGDVWVVTGGAHPFRLKDSLGLQYLARLVAAPDQEIAALDLTSAGDEVDEGDAGALLDPEARRAYRRRLEEIEEELREAEAFHDAIRATRARAEREFLAAELSRAVGLGGRERRSGSAAERARTAVTRRLRDAVRRIAAEDPDLGRRLDREVRTGRFCSYRPM